MSARHALLFVSLIAAIAGAGALRSAEAQTIAAKVRIFNSHSDVRVTGFRFGFFRGRDLSDQVAGQRVGCVSFENTAAREIREVTFRYIFYDALDNYAGNADLVRDGKFTQGAVVESGSKGPGPLMREDCVILPYREHQIALIVVFVKGITYADGSTWITSGPEVPEHLGATPSPSPSPAATP